MENTKQRPIWIAIFILLILSFLGHFFIDFSNRPTQLLGMADWFWYYIAANIIFVLVFYQFLKRYFSESEE
jgi:TRAP-type C4-dicarboxylate transport system permease small subunit